MACKGCGSSKVVRGNCAYCGNPSSDKRNIYYVDVSDCTPAEASAMIKMYEKAVCAGVSKIWPNLCATPTRGKIMSV